MVYYDRPQGDEWLFECWNTCCPQEPRLSYTNCNPRMLHTYVTACSVDDVCYVYRESSYLLLRAVMLTFPSLHLLSLLCLTHRSQGGGWCICGWQITWPTRLLWSTWEQESSPTKSLRIWWALNTYARPLALCTVPCAVAFVVLNSSQVGDMGPLFKLDTNSFSHIIPEVSMSIVAKYNFSEIRNRVPWGHWPWSSVLTSKHGMITYHLAINLQGW